MIKGVYYANKFKLCLKSKYLSKKFDGNLEKIMAAYNGGSVRVRNNTWRNVSVAKPKRGRRI